MACATELGGRPIAIATFGTDDVVGTVSFLPEPGAGVHVYASLFFQNQTFRGKTLGMHIHSHTGSGHFTAGVDSKHGVWPGGHAGDLHNNITVTQGGHVLLAFVDNRVSVAVGRKDCILYEDIVIHTGPDDCGLGPSACSHANGCAGNFLATAQILPYGGCVVDTCC